MHAITSSGAVAAATEYNAYEGIAMTFSPMKPVGTTAEDRATADPLESDLAQLRRQIEQDDVLGARTFVAKLEQRWPDSPRVRRWARVLAPAEVTLVVDRPVRPLEREQEWLRKHRGENPGCWLAIHGDHLVAAHPDLGRVYEAVRAAIGDAPALIHFEGPVEQ
jgi:hypothetical protein